MSIQESPVSTGVTLSESAAKEIKSIITEQDLPGEKTRLRVGVKGGGCSGFSYVLDLVEEEPGEADEEFESQGVRILVDSRSALYLDGVQVDFKDEVMGRASCSRTRTRRVRAAAVTALAPESSDQNNTNEPTRLRVGSFALERIVHEGHEGTRRIEKSVVFFVSVRVLRGRFDFI